MTEADRRQQRPPQPGGQQGPSQPGGEPTPEEKQPAGVSEDQRTDTPWYSRWGRTIAIASVLLAFFAGSLFPSLFGQQPANTDPVYIPQEGIVVWQTANDGTILGRDGDLAVIKGGPVTQVEFEEQGIVDSETQRSADNITRRSEELRDLVDAGAISQEEAADRLAIYIANELSGLTATRLTDNQTQTINDVSQDIIEAARDEITGAIVGRLIEDFMRGEGRGASSA